MQKILVTGSSGLIGSEVCTFFAKHGFAIHGIDNNQRAVFFGNHGDTRPTLKWLRNSLRHFTHHEMDIRDRQHILDTVKKVRPDVIVHSAAQPSHDLAASIPFDDFDTNAVGTITCWKPAGNSARNHRSFSCPRTKYMEMHRIS